ncbi:hypothetical protein V1478_004588 [Vespula squamosa]|uniref:Uncharacterized protein n=1 Tax=Vespula squamosa TaxID=30214 RepID=A0ABD2BGM3_VESSQ
MARRRNRITEKSFASRLGNEILRKREKWYSVDGIDLIQSWKTTRRRKKSKCEKEVTLRRLIDDIAKTKERKKRTETKKKKASDDEQGWGGNGEDWIGSIVILLQIDTRPENDEDGNKENCGYELFIDLPLRRLIRIRLLTDNLSKRNCTTLTLFLERIKGRFRINGQSRDIQEQKYRSLPLLVSRKREKKSNKQDGPRNSYPDL